MQLPLLFWLSTQPTQQRSRLAACGGGGSTGEPASPCWRTPDKADKILYRIHT